MVSGAVEGKGARVDLAGVDLPMVSGSILPANLGAGEFYRSGRRQRGWGFGWRRIGRR
jgi:hypothetical protein